MLVLQSYDAKAGDARLVFDARRLGFALGGTITDVETGQVLGPAGATVVIPMNRPYATRRDRLRWGSGQRAARRCEPAAIKT